MADLRVQTRKLSGYYMQVELLVLASDAEKFEATKDLVAAVDAWFRGEEPRGELTRGVAAELTLA